MLKIRDGIDLKELEKFGFRYDKDDLRYFRKYDNGQLIIDNRCIFDAFIDAKWVLYDTFKDFLIEDLIEADLVEKVSDGNE